MATDPDLGGPSLADHGAALTSYDVVKAIAIVLMVIDHIGLFFVQDNIWLRIIGRQCVPIWLFLIGYSRSQKLDPLLLVSAGIIVATRIVTGAVVFPLNILVTIFCYRVFNRMFLWPFLARVSAAKLVVLAIAIVVSAPAFKGIFIYGIVGFLFSICGFIARNSPQTKKINALFFAAAGLLFGINQGQLFHLSPVQHATLIAGLMLVLVALFNFRPQTYKLNSENNSKSKSLLVFCTMILGRYTMQIYVLNWVLFLLVDRYLLDEPNYIYYDVFRWFGPAG